MTTSRRSAALALAATLTATTAFAAGPITPPPAATVPADPCAEGLRLLRQAYASRPDVEIGAHLGEVLWVSGLREEARKVWREARQRDAGNEVLRETLVRLKADL